MSTTPGLPTPYRVNLSDELWEDLKRLPRQSQQDDALTFLWGHASHTPTRRIPGKLKELRLEYKGLFQYEIDREYRILYRVDEPARQVNVEYIGYHPDWRSKSRGGRRVRR